MRPFLYYNYISTIPVESSSNSLRPTALFGDIPFEATNAGFAPNDLTTSVRTDIVPTTRAAIIDITGGIYSDPYVASTTNRTYRLLGDVTFDGAGIKRTVGNITIDLNGYTLTYNNLDVEGLQSGTVNSSTTGNGVSIYPTINPTGFTLTSSSHQSFVLEFTSGPESGYFYEVVSNTATTLTLENHNQVSDDTVDLRNWENGGPASGDSFRIYDARNTFGVGVNAFSYPSGPVEIVNGYIVQGTGFGRGSNRLYCAGMSPISYLDGGQAHTIGGVSVTWHAANSCGINVSAGNNSIIKYCEITDSGTLVTNRQRSATVISAGSNSLVQYCRIHNHRQGGIGVEESGIVEYNEIYGDSRATNSTAMGTFNTNSVTFRYNNMYKVGQHPVCIGIAEQSNNIRAYGNWAEAMSTRVSPEYGVNQACGFSNRWPNRTSANYRIGPENLYYENCFIVYAHTDTGAPEPYRGRALFQGELAHAFSETFEDNFFGAYSSDNTECYAVTLGNNPVLAQNNTLVSTSTIYWTADSYAPCDGYARWINNTSLRHGSDTGFITFRVGGYWPEQVEFIDGIYGSGTSINNYTGVPTTGTLLRFGYLLTTNVTNSGNYVSGANVSVYDKNFNVLRTGYITDASGTVIVDVPTYYRSGVSFNISGLTPLTIQATSGIIIGSGTISPTGNTSITIPIV